MKRVSLKDIAKMAGVAPSTVSFVLNGKARAMRISETLEAKVNAVAKKAGYHPNQLAVSLRTGKSKILGLIVENISDNFFARLAKVIEEEAEKHGYRVVYCSSENDAKKGHELIRMLSQRQVDGYLITPTREMEKDIKELLRHDCPVVLMDRYFPDVPVPYVLSDNKRGVNEGVSYLISRGYKKIAFVTVDLNLIQMRQRHEGYTSAMRAHKLSVSAKNLLSIPYNHEKEEAVGMMTNFFRANKGLEAVFFATNYLGIMGLESLRRLEMRIPEDIGVVSFDDHDIFRLYPPGITCIEQPIEMIAKTSIQLLMSQSGTSKINLKKSQLHVAAKLIVRGSTK